MKLQADNTQTGNSEEETRVAREEEQASVEVNMEEEIVCGGRGKSSCGGR